MISIAKQLTNSGNNYLNEVTTNMTNKERIQSMDTQQLAFLLSYFSTCDHCIFIEEDCMKKIRNKDIPCEKGIAAWLEQEENP